VMPCWQASAAPPACARPAGTAAWTERTRRWTPRTGRTRRQSFLGRSAFAEPGACSTAANEHLLTGDHNTLAPLLLLDSQAPRYVSGAATYAAPVVQGRRAARSSARRRSRARRRHARGAAPLPGRARAPLRRRQHHGQPGRRQHQAGERARGAERRGRARPGLLAPVPRAGGAHGRRAPARRPARSRRAAPAASMSRFDRWCCTDEAACPGLP